MATPKKRKKRLKPNFEVKEVAMGKSSFYMEIISSEIEKEVSDTLRQERAIARKVFDTICGRLEVTRKKWFETHKTNPSPEKMMATISQVDGVGKYYPERNSWAYFLSDNFMVIVTITKANMLSIILSERNEPLHVRYY